MTTADYLMAALLVLVAAYAVLGIVSAIRTWLKYRGKRLVTCPETQRPEAVDVAARRAALEAFLGHREVRLRDCSRWPEREDCGQECLSQIEAAPGGCLLRNFVSRWYQGETCIYCQRPFREIQWYDHPPALVDVDLKTVQWTEVAPEKLPEIFATHWPVCWNCHVAQAFRREHPELVVDRPWKC